MYSMAILRWQSFFLIFISTETMLIKYSESSSADLRTNQAALFVFGDSDLDAGNNNYINTPRTGQANVWPYGETTFKFPTGRFSDGRLICDFIAEYAWLPLIPPYLQPGNNQYTYGVNFASAGAGVLAETFQGMVIDLKTQLHNFKDVARVMRDKLGYAEAKALFSRAVYLFSVGSNDYGYPFIANSTLFQSRTRKEFVKLVIGNYTTVIKEIYQVGGRKFGFMNIGPMDCIPLVFELHPRKVGSCFKPLSELRKLHNNAFPKAIKQLESRLPGFKYAIHDFYTSASERINNPSKYGFKEGKKACCGSGKFRGVDTCGMRGGTSRGYFELCDNVSDYVFFDSYHFTEKVHQQLGELVWNGLPNITGPYNLKTLFELRET